MPWIPLAVQRETVMIVALASLTAAGVIFAFGAWVMFIRERRTARLQARAPSSDPPGEPHRLKV